MGCTICGSRRTTCHEKWSLRKHSRVEPDNHHIWNIQKATFPTNKATNDREPHQSNLRLYVDRCVIRPFIPEHRAVSLASCVERISDRISFSKAQEDPELSGGEGGGEGHAYDDREERQVKGLTSILGKNKVRVHEKRVLNAQATECTSNIYIYLYIHHIQHIRRETGGTSWEQPSSGDDTTLGQRR